MKAGNLNIEHDWRDIQETNDCLIVIDSNDQVVICNNVAQNRLFTSKSPQDSYISCFPLSCSFLTYDQRVLLISEFKYFVGENLDLLLRLSSGRIYGVKVSITELKILGKLCYSVIIRKQSEHEQKKNEYYQRKTMSEALYMDLLNDALEIHYQPQVNTQDDNLYGVELLARWNSQEFGQVSPEKFISIAEEFGFIDKLDFWVLRRACQQLNLWRQKSLDVPSVSVNFAPSTFRNEAIYSYIYSSLKDNNISPSDLIIEVTENEKIEENDRVIDVLYSIYKMGISISLDDFGTGYSNLKRLLKFPVSQLKLDRVFVKELSRDIAKELSEVVLNISKSMKVALIAEGVEDKEQYDLLKEIGYSIFQGYFFSPPLSAIEFEKWLKKEK